VEVVEDKGKELEGVFASVASEFGDASEHCFNEILNYYISYTLEEVTFISPLQIFLIMSANCHTNLHLHHTFTSNFAFSLVQV
jgi:hypothetical protein